MITLGLDPSLTGFGWCVFDSSGVGQRRVFAKGRWSTSPKTVWVERYVQLREELKTLLDTYLLIEAVGVESPTFGEQWSPGAYALFAMLNEAIWSRRKDVVYFDPVTVKMLTKVDPKLRKGKMFKSDMIDVAKAETGVPRWNADEADAYHVAKFTGRFWMLLRNELRVEDLTPSEYQAFAKVHTFTKGKREGQIVYSGAMFKERQRFFRFSQLPK
jgi:Holliday junction resolvasome RuvABC endonuclease subunit